MNDLKERISRMTVTVDIDDPLIVDYLLDYNEDQRPEKIIEALRIGIIAINSASPTLDTEIVEKKFNEVQKTIDGQLVEFQKELSKKLDDHFKEGSGSVPRSMNELFGDEGKLKRVFEEYFKPDTGKVSTEIHNQIGPNSEFGKSIDPENKESIISKLEEMVVKELEDKTGKIILEFSLDKEESAVNRLKNALSEEVKMIEKSNRDFFKELKEALDIRVGRDMEREKGTDKGREFETILYDRVAEMGRQLGDQTQKVTGTVGALPRNKKGDYVVTLGEDSGAPGFNIVIEAKKEKGYKLADAIDELREAKKNREAEFGIFAFSKGAEPIEIGDFRKIGDDFFVTVDDHLMNLGEPLLFIESAYKISRSLLIYGRRKEIKKDINIEKIKSEVDHIIELISRLSEIYTKINTIKNNSEWIEKHMIKIQEEVQQRLENVLDTVK